VIRTSLRRRPPFAAGLVILAAAAQTSCSRGGQAQGAQERNGGVAVTPVAAAAAERRDLARHVTLTGPVEALRVVGVSSRAAGTILAVHVVEGDRVRPNQLMVELDARETQAQLERARAVLQTAEAAFERAKQLHDQQMITSVEFEQSRAAFETTRSDVALWRTRLEFTRVTAPTAGVVTVKYVEAGSAVATNQRLFDIADDSLLVVRVQMSELDVVRIAAGDSVTVLLDAHPDARLSARVRRVFPAADPQTRLVPVEVALGPAPAGVQVKPGFLARAEFAVEQRLGVLVVPASAVGAATTGPYVYVVDADTVVRRSIQPGLTSVGYVEIATGIAEGDLVVTSGQGNLRTGAPVRITELTGVPDSSGDDRHE
jgi:membrane fusion protein (multidrug efflux system)